MQQEVQRIVKGLTNFRDLGGYETKEGKTVKSGYLYRSDSLHGLRDSDIKFLKEKNLKLIVDYRPENERKDSENIDIPGATYMNLNIDGGNIQELLFSGEVHKLGDADALMPNYYRGLVHETVVYRRLFELILDERNIPMVQHCAAGKDRTGVGVALILLALDVPKDLVMSDYLLTNEYRKQFNENVMNRFKSRNMGEQELAVLTALLDVRKEYLEAAFEEIYRRYDSIDQYFSNALGLTSAMRDELKDRYLIDPKAQ